MKKNSISSHFKDMKVNESKDLKLVTVLDHRLIDGRGAHLPVLQEIGDALTSVAWDTWLAINPHTMKKLGIKRNQLVEVKTSFGSVKVAAYPLPGLHPNTLVIPRGNGHNDDRSTISNKNGVNPLEALDYSQDELSGEPVTSGQLVSLKPLQESYRLAAMQKTDDDLQGRDDIIKTMSLSKVNHKKRLKKSLDDVPDLFPKLEEAKQLEESDEKTIIILVVGEAARAENFSLYGYNRPTNPLLKKQGVIALNNTVSCATYTTLSLRCILSHKDVSTPFSKQYEPLPSYLQRHGVDVVWRTNNWGEPPMKVNTYQRSDELERECKGDQCQYDEVLLSGLGERVRSSMQQNIFIVIHRWGSHGPSYYKRYSKQYEIFKPVCKSVELNQCTNHELVNAYDNSILYTDYFLTQTINLLQDLKTPAVMIYISDHGESLGEFGLYLHGVPYAVAPDVQTHIPFIVWMSPEFIEKKGIDINRIKQSKSHSHQNIFHSVLGAINMHSEVYNDQLDIFNTMIDNLGESDP